MNGECLVINTAEICRASRERTGSVKGKGVHVDTLAWHFVSVGQRLNSAEVSASGGKVLVPTVLVCELELDALERLDFTSRGVNSTVVEPVSDQVKAAVLSVIAVNFDVV